MEFVELLGFSQMPRDTTEKIAVFWAAGPAPRALFLIGLDYFQVQTNEPAPRGAKVVVLQIMERNSPLLSFSIDTE